VLVSVELKECRSVSFAFLNLNGYMLHFTQVLLATVQWTSKWMIIDIFCNVCGNCRQSWLVIFQLHSFDSWSVCSLFMGIGATSVFL
jgi:hypothetical protein